MVLFYYKLNNFKLNREIIHLIVVINNLNKLIKIKIQMNIMNLKDIM